MGSRTGLVLWLAALAACADVADGPGVTERGLDRGYAWPVATGCTQRPDTYVNFADRSRKRKDGSRRAHLGVDIIPPASDGDVYVAKDGIVEASSRARGNGWGNYVIVRHSDGLRTVYAHLVRPSSLAVNDKLLQGDRIGTAGQTETYYVHVHFEILSPNTTDDWTRGRLDPVSVLGPIDGCAVSAKRAIGSA